MADNKTTGSARKSKRVSRRGDTRQDLLLGALKLIGGNKSFDGLSLRELTREVGIVPTGFYRHFATMEELGVALVDDSFRAMRQILNDVRKDTGSTERLIHGFVGALVRHIRKHHLHFHFIASERYGGSGVVRDAIRNGMRLFQGELAVDLARYPFLKDWSTTDLHMLASLLLNSMMAIAEDILDLPKADKAGEKELMQLAENQMRLILLGVPNWRSSEI